MLTTSETPVAGRNLDPLEDLYQSAIESVRVGQTAQVVFDIDDTLFLVKPRKRAIFDVLSQEEGASPALRTALQALTAGVMPYDVTDALRGVGVVDTAVIARVRSRFFELFFDGMYTIHDEPVAGAVTFVQRLHAAGVRIVYLSGRPDTMREWSRNTLSLAGFPVDEARTALVLKGATQHQVADAIFKGQMASAIARDGTVLACFDNEPANLNAMYAGFQEARFFWLRTDGLANPPALVMDAHPISHFLNARERLRLIYQGSPDGLPTQVSIGTSLTP